MVVIRPFSIVIRPFPVIIRPETGRDPIERGVRPDPDRFLIGLRLEIVGIVAPVVAPLPAAILVIFGQISTVIRSGSHRTDPLGFIGPFVTTNSGDSGVRTDA